MDYKQLFPSPYLKIDDLAGRSVIVTLALVESREIGPDRELKLGGVFREFPDKFFVLNRTNCAALEDITQSCDTDVWIGKRVVLFPDPNVMYAGKKVSAIRIRPMPAKKPAPSSIPAEPEYIDDPFEPDAEELVWEN